MADRLFTPPQLMLFDILNHAEEDYVTDKYGHLRWTFVLKADDLRALAKVVGFIDLHDAIHHAQEWANAKNILTDTN